MTTQITTMAIHVTKRRMTIQSVRNHRLLRKSLENQILQEPLLLMCLHRHQECLHQCGTRHLRHHSTLAELNAAQKCVVLIRKCCLVLITKNA